MPRKKPTDPSPVTVAELLLALASYPQDALLWTTENGSGGGEVWVHIGPAGDDAACLWEGHAHTRPQHYQRPDVVVQEVERAHPGDEYAIAAEFLAWLRQNDIELSHPGHGHNEVPSSVMKVTRDRFAEQFAERPLA